MALTNVEKFLVDDMACFGLVAPDGVPDPANIEGFEDLIDAAAAAITAQRRG